MPSSAVRVGLVGTGPWARLVHAPLLAAGPGTELVGVWGRRAEAATELASAHGAQGYASVDQMFAGCDAVAFAVPPAVQAELAGRAATAGKALLLEKPVAESVGEAEQLVATIEAAGVLSMVLLTWRYTAAARRFLAEAPGIQPIAGRGAFVSGAFLAGSPFATPWRLEHGALLDVGPHVIDLLEAALGPVTGVRRHGQAQGWTGLLLDHEGGAVSEASLCSTVPVEPYRAGVELYGRRGHLVFDGATAVDGTTFATVAQELATMVTSGTPHPLDAAHGLHLQRLIGQALSAG